MSLGNSITIQTSEQLEAFITNIREDFEKHKFIEIKVQSGIRSIPQNRAMHLYFKMVAQALNDAGIDTTNFFKEGFTLPFTEHIVKDSLWLPLMEAVTKKTSTAKLKKEEVTKIYEHLNLKLAERGIVVPFPSNDSMMNSQRVR